MVETSREQSAGLNTVCKSAEAKPATEKTTTAPVKQVINKVSQALSAGNAALAD